MFNNRNRNGALWGTILGASMGIFLGSKMTPMNRRRMMRKARRATSNFKDGIDSWWN